MTGFGAVLQVAAEELLGLTRPEAERLVSEAETAIGNARAHRTQSTICPDLCPEIAEKAAARVIHMETETARGDCIDTEGETVRERVIR